MVYSAREKIKEEKEILDCDNGSNTKFSRIEEEEKEEGTEQRY